MKFILFINVKMPTIVDILTFISMINTTSEKQETSLFVGILVFMSRRNFMLNRVEHQKKVNNPGA